MTTHAYTAFGSPNSGPLGTVSDADLVLHRRRVPTRLPAMPSSAALPIPILTVALDAPPAMVQEDVAGLVVAAAGGGNTPPGYLDLAEDIMARRLPVALTTRCPSGRVLPGYGFPGGSTRWWEAGAIFTGTLDPLKARILLALALGTGLDPDGIAALATAWGGGRSG
jgi:L-asparaginase